MWVKAMARQPRDEAGLFSVDALMSPTSGTALAGWAEALVSEAVRRGGHPEFVSGVVRGLYPGSGPDDDDVVYLRVDPQLCGVGRESDLEPVFSWKAWNDLKSWLVDRGVDEDLVEEAISPTSHDEALSPMDPEHVRDYVMTVLDPGLREALVEYFRGPLEAYTSSVASFADADPGVVSEPGWCVVVPREAVLEVRPGPRFEYVDAVTDPASNRVECTYRIGSRQFREVHTFPEGGNWAQPAVAEAARLLFLLAGVSYYKTSAPPIIDLGDIPITPRERAFLRDYYIHGMGEFSYRLDDPRFPEGLDLRTIEIIGGRDREEGPRVPSSSARRPLIPFGGGIDSIASVELLRDHIDDGALFVVNRPGDRFDAIEAPAAVAGLPIVRAERLIDSQVLRSRELGFLNGHVPVTAVISAMGILAAALQGRDAVVMSNEWSSSAATLVLEDGRRINHQYSKGDEFETAFRDVLLRTPGMPDYFSLLRPFSELWISRFFATHCQAYLGTFRSCNRAFHIDRSIRADKWCGTCDKCAFIDLILAPFVSAADLRTVFDGNEPLENPELVDKFRRLMGLVPDSKPWECVGDVAESRVAARLALVREDRAGGMLATLVAEAATHPDSGAEELMRPLSTHHIPDRYAPALDVV